MMINSSKTKPPKAEGSNSNRFKRSSKKASSSSSAPVVAKPVSSSVASSSSRAVAENVVVALNAAKGINRYALEWTLTNVVQPEDHITLVALLQEGRNGRRRWGLPNLAGDCANRSHKAGKMGNAKEMAEEVSDSCSYMMQQLQRLCDAKQVKISVKVVPGNTKGAVAIEAQRVGAAWIILDSHLKKEEGKFCMDQLQCNLVIVKRSDAKILRLNLNMRTVSERGNNNEGVTDNGAAFQSPTKVAGNYPNQQQHLAMHSGVPEEITSFGSPGARTPFTATDKGTSSASSSEPGTSPLTSAEAGKTHTKTHRDADDELIDETDSASEYGLHDALSDEESSSDESYSAFLARHPVCKTAYGSPDQRYKTSTLSYFGSSDYASQPWLDYSLGNAQRESYCVDPWMATSKSRPASASATPRITANYQGRASTPASPLSSSKRFTGSSRLSLSMREGSHQVNPSAEGSNVNTILHQRNSRYAHRSNTKAGYDATDNGRWSNRSLTTQDLLDKFSRWDQDSESGLEPDMDSSQDLERTSSVRRAMSLVKHVPAGPPPLCSICQHKAPVFGKPPRRFTYAELELATGGFSQANFLAEGGFGSVHRGILPDGQAVAVKQHKLASSQGDIEFCSEVEVLSCAQHRNVVMLIGYCIEDKRRLLVYEFICNGSLDSHLYGKDKGCLGWPARQKIAVGAARGLRYLHEECRVGCIVHRDMRPNNILLTHDYEPMVGDFGLARWQPDGDLGVQTRVIGTFGYLAPEYAQSGQVTEKADVYSFGVVLLELATGRKAVDINRPKGQQCLTEWARPLLEEHATQVLIDPLLNGSYSEYEVYCMLHAASLCLRKDPHLRPRMSQVLRILEGDVVIDKITPPVSSYGSRLTSYKANAYNNRPSSRLNEYKLNRATAHNSPLVSYNGSLGAEAISAKLSSMCNDALSGKNGAKLSYEALKAAYKDCSYARRLSYEDMM